MYSFVNGFIYILIYIFIYINYILILSYVYITMDVTDFMIFLIEVTVISELYMYLFISTLIYRHYIEVVYERSKRLSTISSIFFFK